MHDATLPARDGQAADTPPTDAATAARRDAATATIDLDDVDLITIGIPDPPDIGGADLGCVAWPVALCRLETARGRRLKASERRAANRAWRAARETWEKRRTRR